MRLLVRRQRASAGSEALSLFIGFSNATSGSIWKCSQCRRNTTCKSTDHSQTSLTLYSLKTFHHRALRQNIPQRLLAQPRPNHHFLLIPPPTRPARPSHLHHPLHSRIAIPLSSLQAPQHFLANSNHTSKFRLPRLSRRPPRAQQNRHLLHKREDRPADAHQRPPSRCLPCE